MNKQQQHGFTLVELIIVIVILGILAAMALPRFIGVTKEARLASLNGFAGGVTAAMALPQARWYATGANAATVAMADGTNVAVSSGTGIPTGTSAGIGAALRCANTDCNGFTADYTTPTAVTFQMVNATATQCVVTYNANTGAVTKTTGADCTP